MNSLEIIERKIKELKLKLESYELEPKTIINEVKNDNVRKQLNEYKVIKKDLEILNILKDNIMTDEEEKVITLFSKNKEVVEKVKEWLYVNSLEALNIIKNNKGKSFCEAYKEPLNAIKQDLERLEEENKKLKQALDILATHWFISIDKDEITQTEYDLLKEVLKYD